MLLNGILWQLVVTSGELDRLNKKLTYWRLRVEALVYCYFLLIVGRITSN
ncbi:MAG: hypothetical protein QNJ38_03530 [Prochloraceae cyanobacterium]|nr:hypothetical protein [Prochloraceae cyanobacterium]